MAWWGWTLLAWVVLSVPVALVIGRVIRGPVGHEQRWAPQSHRKPNVTTQEVPEPREKSA